MPDLSGTSNFQTQFSLSLELTRLVPGVVQATVAGRSIIELARELSRSGSDILVEDDLADYIGRNRIERRLESSFRTAVRHSSKLQFRNLVDIVLEAGAGATVQRSIGDRAYLSSVIQLSLLTFVHEPHALAKALRKALDDGAAPSKNHTSIPELDRLTGTLIAIREQTATYRWELVFNAIENTIYKAQDNKFIFQRAIPPALLRGLLDALPALQYFPDHRLVHVRAFCGISTIAAWAHNVLGLVVTVATEANEPARQFGDGPVQVVIEKLDIHQSAAAEGVSLLSGEDHDQLDLSIMTSPLDAQPISGAYRHQAQGFGVKTFQCMGVRHPGLLTELSRLVSAICVALVKRNAQEVQQNRHLPKMGDPGTSTDRVIEVASVLFYGVQLSIDSVEELATYDSLLHMDWCESDLPPALLTCLKQANFKDAANWHNDRGDSQSGIGKSPTSHSSPVAPGVQLNSTVYTLCRVIMAFSCVKNFANCHRLPLHLYGGDNRLDKSRPVSAFPPCEAWSVIASLLFGRNLQKDRFVERASIISHMGWSLVLGTLHNRSPGETEPDIFIHEGVPARKGERKHWIVDVGDDTSIHTVDHDAGCHRVEHRGGDRAILGNLIPARFLPPLYSIDSDTFEVVHQIQMCSTFDSAVAVGHVQLGLRIMQALAWDVVCIPDCVHGSHSEESVEIPPGCLAFSGWRTAGPINPAMASVPGAWDCNAVVHIASTAGSGVAQWAMLSWTRYWAWLNWRGERDEAPTTYVRNDRCCLTCAMAAAVADRPDSPKILIP